MTSHDFPGEGAELGAFRIGRRLGAGGMGVVHEALDTHLDRLVALKVIAPHLGDDESFRARFTREARAQASLDSPHVVQVYSSGEVDGRLYIASQLIPDGDLGRMLRDHGLPPTRVALHLMAQVADGLADAHAAGLVHRDIKPANVLLRHRDHALTAYLADFGIARQVARPGDGDPDGAGAAALTDAGAAAGTPSYMAPELHTGGDAGPACDVYSLGCLLWATLSGAAPYAGGTDYQVVSGHVSGPLPQVEPTGPLAVEVNRVLRLALAKDPRDRYPSARALRDDLVRASRMRDDARPVRPANRGAAAGSPAAPPSPVPAPPSASPGARQFYATAPPTPTPSAGPLSSAPPAPSLAPRAMSSSPPRPPRRVRTWVPVAVGAAVLAVAAAVLVLVLRDGGDDDAAGRPAAEVRDAEVVRVILAG
jgi:serine/threonine protein kinase